MCTVSFPFFVGSGPFRGVLDFTLFLLFPLPITAGSAGGRGEGHAAQAGDAIGPGGVAGRRRARCGRPIALEQFVVGIIDGKRGGRREFAQR